MFENSSFISRCKKKYLYMGFETYGISFSEGVVILVIGNNLLCNQDSISMLAGIDKFRLAKILSGLEKRELICREMNPSNKREKLVKLSDKGQAVNGRLNEVLEGWQRICFGALSEEEMGTLARIVDKITYSIMEYEGLKMNGKEVVK